MAFLVAVAVAGCRSASEPWHILVGDSTRGVEKARRVTHTEVIESPLSPDACFEHVLTLAEARGLKILRRVAEQRVAILIGIPGSIDTTEVGVFVDPRADGQSRIEISSFSVHARQWVHAMLESGL
jgi:hypothetical protein